MIAIVVKGYPRLSETFVAQEILALEQRGLPLTIVSLRHPTDQAVHPVHREIRAPALYLPEYVHQEPNRVWRGLRRATGLPGFAKARDAWLADLLRDPSRNRVRRFAQAAVLAAELPVGTRWIYAHFIHTPASVARYAGMMCGLPFSVSAHAKDIWTTRDWEKWQKLMAARWAVTCTAANLAHLRSVAPEANVELLYHGLDLARFPASARVVGPDGSDPASPVRLLCVARAVEKKGLDTLLDAVARLPADLHWRLVHIGGGPLLPALGAQADRLGIAPLIDWRAAQPQEQVIEAYRASDIFVLPSRIAGDGDRDGLPNVLMEAMTQELAVVATAVSAIPELVEDGVNGLLVPSDAPATLAGSLEALIRDPARRLALGGAGRARVEASFRMAGGIDRLYALLAAA